MSEIQNLKAKLQQEWTRVLKQSPFIHAIESGEFNKDLYALYLIQTHHYTRHNARNQALVGVRSFDVSPQYVKFCFEHAAEETGHEMMPIHDLKKMGYRIDFEALPEPLPSAEVLIAYLYWISGNGNPLQRLGYSFWAESCYEYINPVLQKIQRTLQLSDSEMTFFVAHSRIDAKHSEEVEEMILHHAKTPQDWKSIETVMLTSLRLTERMMDEVYAEYLKVRSGESDLRVLH